ncbi:protein SPA1-RELATED 4-like [Papaver somniferum]|uniref:protein SPA1-RELATED 4-like n=1 Tax=Papaver somniferum TaxID=3469 RepID=UPI000E6F87FE|nr:protein SPA1-RELATED 4-like [Papaver somniferum]XP_026411665.1 protein SPA1-RELATED 4-like [Papaver somniferum]
MAGSSGLGWEKSDSSRGLNGCVISRERNGLHDNGNRLSSLGNASNNDRFMQGGKVRETGSSRSNLMEQSDLSLRQWLDKPERTVDHLECLHIFKQIVETVNLAHSQGVVINNVRPSCFVMSLFNRVSFIESASSSSDSDSSEDRPNRKPLGGQNNSSTEVSHPNTSQRASDTSCLRSSSVFPMCKSSIEEIEERNVDDSRKLEEVKEIKRNFPLKQILAMEIGWYTSPEEVEGSPSSFVADIYRLGVLLFELFCAFSSTEEKLRTMSNLRHRVLPPQLLLKWPKEASFCLWLLHPRPNTRPKMSEVLQSEFLVEPRDSMEEREAAMSLREVAEEQELIAEFFLLTQQKKQEAVEKLQDTITLISSDIDEVQKQHLVINIKGGVYTEINSNGYRMIDRIESLPVNPDRNDDWTAMGSKKHSRSGMQVQDEEVHEQPAKVQKSGTETEKQESILSKSSRLMKNFKKLEAAYFSTRLRATKPKTRPRNRYSGMNADGKGSIVMTEGSSVDNFSSKEGHSEESKRTGWIEPFLEGLCKYLSYSKLKVKADLKQGDLLNSSNLVCSLNFDRDKELFATAGVNKKIKVFECDSILNEDRDIHYPVVEMASKSKISSLCFNSYIKSQIASSDFDGVVQVWDVTRSQVTMEMREHERRVWSVDFSLADPTKLASGSDDCAVKLWNINQVGSIGTIKTKANVCCVQFPPNSSHSLAIGSADHNIYCYDLRSTKIPLCTLRGHSKTVSYVKFVDSTTLVSASTDNTLKLWDLTTCTYRVLDSPQQTFTGHTNVKNFVGLSISDGYIATGSETNEVFVYHKAFPMPVLSYKFCNTDPVFGYELDDASQFISAVCWRGQSSTLVAANSTGNIKLLEMV